MENEFIPYKESLSLKELGFDEQCLALYDLDGKITIEFVNWKNAVNRKNNYLISAPLYQQAFKWLWNKTGKYIIPIQKNDKEWLAIGIVYKTYEEAELECLKKLIKIVKKNK